MNLTFLETFLTVLETGNLNKAAERLHVTQSTISARLDALESALGRQLLVRERRGARMTRAGFELRPHAELLVNGWKQARNSINLPKGYMGLFSFACEFDVWHAAGKNWLYSARVAHPGLAYEGRPGRRAELIAWLGTGITDVALTMEPVSAPGLEMRELAEERIICVSRTPRRVDVWDPDYIFVDLGAEFRRQHAVAYPEAKTASITFSTSAWALEHLMDYGGSAYLPEPLVERHLRSSNLHLVEGAPVFHRTLYLIWREATASVFPWVREEFPASPRTG